MIQKYGSAHWEGGLRDGKGSISTETGVLKDQAYSFAKRFGEEKGTNPEELIGAAHAACFAMALSNGLQQAGFTTQSIDARSTVTLDPSGPTITRAHLDLTASVPGIDEDQFREIAEATKQGCPVSKVLAGADLTLDAKLA